MSTKDATARKNEQILMELVKQEANKHCADCGQKGTRWASWNLGVFLCIRCGGLHRRLGTHISRVKSINLDKWTDEQVENMVNKGNAKVNAIYNPQPDRFPFPSYSGDMEQYIRDKYERKLFMSSEMAASMSARSPILASADAVGTGETIGHANSPATVAAMRYPLQMKSLQEMGFVDVTANQTALLSTAGNLQQAIEMLLSGKASKLRVSPPPAIQNGEKARATLLEEAVSPAARTTSVVEDLADIFGAPPPPPPISTTAAKSSLSRSTFTTASSKNPSASILDMDLPVPGQEEEHFSEEYEEFESAVSPRVSNRGALSEEIPGHSSVPGEDFATEAISGTVKGSRIVESPVTKARPSIVDTGLGSNPWATSTDNAGIGRGAGEAFDDIDPFRGYVPPTNSGKK